MKNKNFIRIIPKLDIKNGMLIKGINLEGLRVLGDPFNFAKYYYENHADEICYIDNVATLYGTNNLSSFISQTAKNIFIPISVGGGIRKIQDIERIFKAGADKVCINSAVIDNPKFLHQASRIFGSANITVVIEYVKIDNKYLLDNYNLLQQQLVTKYGDLVYKSNLKNVVMSRTLQNDSYQMQLYLYNIK